MSGYTIATRKIEIAALVFQRCMGCGADKAPHPHERELCLECQISDLHWSLTHWQARIWDEIPEDEHALTRDFMTRDLGVLRGVRAALRKANA